MATARPAVTSPILIAVDLLPHSSPALQHGFALAQQHRVPVVVLHVVHETAENAGFYRSRNRRNSTTPMLDIAGSMLRELLECELEQLPFNGRHIELKSRVIQGVPATRIVEVADRLDACCIVMASSGYSGLAHLWFGSVVDSVRKRTRRKLVSLDADITKQIDPKLGLAANPLHQAH